MLSNCKKAVFAALLVAGLCVGAASAVDYCGSACAPAAPAPIRYAPVNACAPACAPAPAACAPAPVACRPAPVACAPAPVACDPCGSSFQSSSVAGYNVTRSVSGVTYGNDNAIYLVPTMGGLMETRGYQLPANEVDNYYRNYNWNIL